MKKKSIYLILCTVVFLFITYSFFTYVNMEITFDDSRLMITTDDYFNPLTTIKSYKGGEVSSFNLKAQQNEVGDYEIVYKICNGMFCKTYRKTLTVKGV